MEPIAGAGGERQGGATPPSQPGETRPKINARDRLKAKVAIEISGEGTFAPGRDRTSGRLNLLSVEQILSRPPRRYLMPGLLAPSELSVWWGAPKCGKSFLLLRLAYGLALGRGMWGRTPERPLRVLYVAAEGEGGLGGRLRALRDQFGDPGDAFGIIAQPAMLGPPSDDLDAVKTLTKAMRAEIVIIDTLARTFGLGNEDTAQDMGGFIAAMDSIRMEAKAIGAAAGPHVMVVHHGPKDEEAKTPRGSGALLGAADLVVRVRKGKDGAPSLATVTDAKDDPDGTELPFRLEVVDLPPGADGAPRATCVAVEADTPAAPRRPDSKLSEQQKGWLKDISDIFAESGHARERVPKAGMAPCVTLTRDQVRDGLRERGRFGDVTRDARLTGADRNALYRMLNALKDKGKLGLSDHFVWML